MSERAGLTEGSETSQAISSWGRSQGRTLLAVGHSRPTRLVSRLNTTGDVVSVVPPLPRGEERNEGAVQWK
ncbi:MAG: hypothetical protein J07HQX50_02879 [Haloquadratum sp. J07HQX50]|nr:MAG: hypothetical protein J07HQX50_02879 [Haloquadratum sp. J07HQX50]